MLEKKSVEDWLNTVSYKIDPSYVPSEFALEFVNFIKLIHGEEGAENKTPVIHYNMLDNISGKRENTANMCHRGVAKAIHIDEKVLSIRGHIPMIDIRVGDQVFTREGKLATVTHKSEVFTKNMYDIHLADGRVLRVSEDHLNILRERTINKHTTDEYTEKVLTVPEILEEGPLSPRRWYIPTAEAIELPEAKWEYASYVVGAVAAEFTLNRMDELLGRKVHLPKSLMWGSKDQRMDLLQGVLDTSSTIDGYGGVIYETPHKQLYEDICWLVRSLGGESIEMSSDTSQKYITYIRMNDCPFKLYKNRAIWKPNLLGQIEIVSITGAGKGECQCISVDDPTKSYLAGEFVVTHNTTLLAEYLFLYIAVYGGIPDFGNIDYALYVSDSIENGVKKMRLRLQRQCENSAFLQRYISKYKITDIRWYFQNAQGKEFVVTGHGAQTGVRGTVELGTRPQLAVLDDLLSDDDAKSPAIISRVEDTIYSAVDYALHPNKRKIIWSGTPFNAKDPLYKAVESGAWHVNVYPVCEQFPCSREEFRGSWEDRFGYDYVMNQYTKAKALGKLDSFNQELMLRIMSSEERLIDDADIVWFKYRNLLNNRGAYNYYITTDFATSDKQHADFSVINVWAYSNNGDWLWVDGFCKRALMDETIDNLFRLAQEWRPQEVGIEVTGQQGGFISWIQSEQMNRNIYFTLSKGKNSTTLGIRPTKDKMSRFQQNAVPLFKSKKIWLPEEYKEAQVVSEILAEVTLATFKGFKSKHDDCLDTITMLAELNAWKPSEVAVEDDNDYDSRRSTIWEDGSPDDGENSYFV